jgi:phenol hydroxylase P2 protein
MQRNVSITLQSQPEVMPIVEAIKADNPAAVISQFPSMVKIDCPGRMVIRRATVSQMLGRDWEPQEIQLALITLSGNIDEDDEQFVLAWR